MCAEPREGAHGAGPADALLCSVISMSKNYVLMREPAARPGTRTTRKRQRKFVSGVLEICCDVKSNDEIAAWISRVPPGKPSWST